MDKAMNAKMIKAIIFFSTLIGLICGACIFFYNKKQIKEEKSDKNDEKKKMPEVFTELPKQSIESNVSLGEEA
tara:strand:- start:127 stop:345 length:219 start_codon:yes stop_codon:yes gene_type:complete